jgi:long-chain acyl-CoA synthetase
MSDARPYPWERVYPPGVRWDAPIEISTLPELLDRAVAEYGDRTAIEFNDRRISFRDLGARVDRAAAGLAALGVGPDTSVALYLPNTPYHPIGFFAVLKLGARVVHLSPLDPVRALRRKLEDSEARVLITTNFAPMIPPSQQLLADRVIDHLIVGEDEAWGPGPIPRLPLPAMPGVRAFAALDAAPPVARWPAVAPDDVAVLQYTGGTTGLPRAAMLTHANLTAAVSIYDAWASTGSLAAAPDDKVIGVLPLFHIYGLVTVMLRCIRHGVELLVRPRFDLETTLQDIERKRATRFPGVPTMWIAMASVPGIEKRDLSSLRSISSGGAPMPAEVAGRLEQLTGHRLGGGWGMTETSPAGTSLLPDQPNAPGLIGVPLPGIVMDVAALDDPRRVLPPGERGEIRIKGPNVTKGYWKRPEETASAFVDGFFLTGDVGYMTENGVFYLVDRKKDMIISGAFNVYPSMIEQAIYEHPHVEEAAVIGIADPYRGQAAKAFVKLRAGAPELTLEDLRAFLADKLGRHELPNALEIRAALPRTNVGKLSKRELIEEEQARAAAAPAVAAPPSA